MANTFNCPACGVTLDYPGSGETIHCPYCDASIIAPDFPQQQAEEPGLRAWHLPPQTGAFEEVISQLNAGNDIMAIRLYRQITGCGLVEAKNAIDDLRAGRSIKWDQALNQVGDPITDNPAIPPEQMAEMKRLLQIDRKTDAIKIYRQYTQCSLRESKEAVEALARGEMLPMPKKQLEAKKGSASSCGRMLMMFFVALIIIAILVVILEVYS